MSDDDYATYVSVTERKAKAKKLISILKKKDKNISPVIINSRIKIAHSFWGQAWCKNIESYRDLDYRLEQGRSYVRSGAVVDLRISEKQVRSQVIGSELYKVKIDFNSFPKESWNSFTKKCTSVTDSIVDLLSGKIPDVVSKLITDESIGLFPNPNEIKFDCNCLDYADVCKHIAATLYGIGVHFDKDPNLFFILRGVDPSDLIKKSREELTQGTKDTISNETMEDLFNIEIGTSTNNFTPEKSVLRLS